MASLGDRSPAAVVSLGSVTVASDLFPTLDNTFVRELAGLYEPWQAAPSSAPELLVLNEPLADELGLDADALRTPEGVALLVGNEVPGRRHTGRDGLRRAPVRRLLAAPRRRSGAAARRTRRRPGDRRDLHLKGSGRTPFARGGDGKAAVGPMLREYVISEAMHALGIPTTRSLAVVATGDPVARETLLPGAILVRVAASHLRVGTFQYAAGHDDVGLLQRLADYAIARHYPDVGRRRRTRTSRSSRRSRTRRPR